MGQQPGTPVDVCNLALAACGQMPITSILAPQTPNEDMGAMWYDQVRRETLRDFIFNFSRKPLTLYSGTPPIVDPQFAAAFALPADMVRLLTIGDRLLYGGNTPTQFYNIAGGWLYCDNTITPDLSAQGLLIEYIFDAALVPLFDPSFVKVLYLRLAAGPFARKLKLPKAVRDDLKSDLAEAELRAAAISGQEKPVRRVQRSRVRDVRRSGGIFRNNTVI